VLRPLEKYNDFAPDLNELSGAVVDCAFQVHKELGPGFLEINYEDAFVLELKRAGLAFEKQKAFHIPYKGDFLESGFRFDLVVENRILIELKAIEKIHPVHQSQIYAYLRATNLPIGFLINFNVPLIKEGIQRFVLRNSEAPRANDKRGEVDVRR
jgi:GxxExxY protein